MLTRRAIGFAGSVAGALFVSAVASAQAPGTDPTDPPRTSVEDVRERYRASRAADKPQAETPGDAVEVGEGRGTRAIEPVDPVLDPSADAVAPPGAPQDPTLVHGPFPVGFDRLRLTAEVRMRMTPVAKDYDGRIAAILSRIAELRLRAVEIEATALLDQRAVPTAPATPAASVVEVTPPAAGQRTAGYRPGDAAPSGSTTVIVKINPDSRLAGPSAAIRDRIEALHAEAVRLEMDKLVALETLLTQEQVHRLRTFRVETLAVPVQEAPAGVAVPVRPVPPPGGKVEIEQEGPRGEREIEIKNRNGRVKIEREN